MSQNIKDIQKSLSSCEEVDSPYDLIIGNHIKYITLNDEEEYFY